MGVLKKVIESSKGDAYLRHEEKHDEAQSLLKQQKLDQAAELLRKNLDWSLTNLGQDHEATVYDQEILASTLNRLGQYKEAEALNQIALDTRTRVEGLSNPSGAFLDTQRSLANDFLGQQNYTRAVQLFEANYEARMKDKRTGPTHAQTLKTGFSLAFCWHRLGKFQKARQLNREILAARKATQTPEIDIVRTQEALAFNQFELGNFKSARTLHQANLDILKKAKSSETLYQKILVSSEKGIGLCNQKIKDKDDENKKKKEAEKKAAQQDDKRDSNEKEGQINPGDKTVAGNDPKSGAKEDKEKKDSSTSTQPISIPQIKTPPDRPKPPSLPSKFESSENASQRRANSPDTRIDSIQFRYVASSQTKSQIGTPNRPSTPASSLNVGDTPPPIPFANGQRKPSSPSPSSKENKNMPPPEATAPKSDLARSRSLSGKGNKSPGAPRAKSASFPIKPDNEELDGIPYRQLFDIKEGKSDEKSIEAVDSWFYSLRTETQKLLKTFRRTQSKRVKIAILDTGVDLQHPSFKADQKGASRERRIKKPEDFLDPSGNAQDTCGHGTHCVGLLRLIAPEADIYVARVVKDLQSDLNPDVIAKAIDRACGSGTDSEGKKNWNVDIITMSFGFYGWNLKVEKAILDALRKPVLVFAAASNNGTRRKMTFPARMSGVICVNSANANGKPSDFNPKLNPGKNLSILGEDVLAPWIKSKDSDENEKRMSGTSVATPIAAAVAALVMEFAYQDAETLDILKDLQPYLKKYDGMTEIFSHMSESTFGYKNVVPWNILNHEFGGDLVANRLKFALWGFRGQG